MSERPIRVMLDTNVLVDLYCPWHAGSDVVRQLIGALRSRGAELFLPVHAMKDVLYVLSQEFRREARRKEGSLSETAALAASQTALACMRNAAELTTAVGADGSDLWLADKYLSVHHDFEDNLVLAACRRVKADYMVTGDLTLIAHANVLAKTPGQMLELMSLGTLATFGEFGSGDVSWQLRP